MGGISEGKASEGPCDGGDGTCDEQPDHIDYGILDCPDGLLSDLADAPSYSGASLTRARAPRHPTNPEKLSPIVVLVPGIGDITYYPARQDFYARCKRNAVRAVSHGKGCVKPRT